MCYHAVLHVICCHNFIFALKSLLIQIRILEFDSKIGKFLCFGSWQYLVTSQENQIVIIHATSVNDYNALLCYAIIISKTKRVELEEKVGIGYPSNHASAGNVHPGSLHQWRQLRVRGNHQYLHHTLGVTWKRAASGWIHLRSLAHAQHSSEETLQRCQTVGDTGSNLTGPRIDPTPPAPTAMFSISTL